jgi:hypothetical protein
MALRLRKEPLVLGFSIAAGVCVGLLVGPVLLPWGIPIGVLGALIVLSIGLWREAGHRELFYVLLVVASFDVGFLAANASRMLLFLRDFAANRPDALRDMAEQAARQTRRAAAMQWATMGVPLVLATVVLVRDLRRVGAPAR